MSSKAFVFALVASVLLDVALAGKADESFKACCKSKGLVEDCCVWESPDANPAFCLMSTTLNKDEDFPNWAYCATGGKDNTACCTAANVTEPLCLELCDGTKPISHQNPFAYASCRDFKRFIIECNHDANNN